MMKAVILAAGKGTRLDPLTKYRPKHLLPIAGKPLIENIISALKSIGIKDVYIIVGYRDQEIRNLIGDGGKYNLRVTYVTQREQLGTAHAIKMVKEYLKNEEFLVIYGDVTVEDKILLQAIEKHRESGATTTIVSIEVEDPWNYGVMELGEGDILKNIIEKPERGREPSRHINAGIYVMRGEEVFEAVEETPLSKRGEYEITDTFKILLRKGEKVAVCVTKGRWWRDIGRPWDLLEANEEYMNRGEYYGRIFIGKGSVLRGKCTMIPPLIIGERCIIGGGAVLGPYTYIGNEVEVGFKSRIVESIILEKTIILNNV
ncbi:MAG: sugar phosphate nucleotidyltransferase, partial [Candidatus Methanomethylicia archaeon]